MRSRQSTHSNTNGSPSLINKNSDNEGPPTPKTKNSKKGFKRRLHHNRCCKSNYQNLLITSLITMIIIFLYSNHNYMSSKGLSSSHKANEIKFDSEGMRNTVHPPPRLEKEYEIPNSKESKELKSITSNEQSTIPNNLIFTHYKNLLNLPSTENDTELLVLQSNIQNTISLHPNSTIKFLTDKDCLKSISNVLGTDTPLLNYFQKEKEGMYKADICRGAALYEYGGLYFDVDIQARMNIFSVMKEDTKFVTIQVHGQSKWKGAFFQAFIGATRHHPVLLKYLELFVDYYEHRLSISRGPLGVLLLRKAYDIVYEIKDDEDIGLKDTEIWKEIRYNHETFPNFFPDLEPTVGKRRACHMVVYIPKTRIIPFYSRVRGSRMCGGKDSDK